MESLEQEFAIHLAEDKIPYFEGWYSKIVTKELSLAVIFGVSITETKKYAFIQTNDTLTGSYYEEFPWNQLSLQEHPFSVSMGDNMLSMQSMSLHLSNGMQCSVDFSAMTPIHRSSYQPTIMGPFAYLKNMECIHAVISLQHDVTGTLRLKDHSYIIDGLGYMEKDRGTSFPLNYTWFQSNHANKKMTAFFFSLAHIPMQKLHFQGCICILMVEGVQYRFATYLGAHIRYVKDKEIYVITQLPYKVYIKMVPNQTYGLLAPKNGNMDTMIYESLNSEAIVHVLKHGKRIHTLAFKKGGYEHFGD